MIRMLMESLRRVDIVSRRRRDWDARRPGVGCAKGDCWVSRIFEYCRTNLSRSPIAIYNSYAHRIGSRRPEIQILSPRFAVPHLMDVIHRNPMILDRRRRPRKFLTVTVTIQKMLEPEGKSLMSHLTLKSRGKNSRFIGISESLERRILLAPIAPLGDEFRTNTSWRGDQGRAAVSVDPVGKFVVTWQSTEYFSPFVYAQRYDSAGSRVGSEISVSSDAGSTPVVGTDATGNFVIAWNGGNGARAQRYASNGTPLGAPIVVSASGGYDTTIAVSPAGDFVIAWQSEFQQVLARRYHANGSPLSTAFRITTQTNFIEASPAIGVDASGNFVVTWASYERDGSGDGVYARRFSAAGNSLGSEFRVNVTTAGNQQAPAVAVAASGDFFIAWSNQQTGSTYETVYRSFDATGAATTGDSKVGVGEAGGPSIAVDGAGNVMIASSDADDTVFGTGEVYAWRYSSSGTYLDSFQVNTTTEESQSAPAIATDSIGRLVVAWKGYRSGGWGDDIFARRYTIVTNPASVSGRAFEDTNANGIQETGEPGRAAVSVYLYRQIGSSSTILRSITTSSDGTYLFTDLLPADGYGIRFDSVVNRTFTRMNAGNDDSIDSDVNTYGYVDLNLQHAQMFGDVDAGFAVPASVSGTVYFDRNLNRVRDGNEDGLGGWAAFADENANGRWDFEVERGAYTSTLGNFSINGLIPGSHIITTVAQTGWRVIGRDEVSLLAGQAVSSVMLGNSISTRHPTAEFRVNSYAPDEQSDPSIAADPSGNSVVVWESFGQDGSGYGIYAQRYDATGNRIGGEFRANATTPGDQHNPVVAMDSLGNFAIAWISSESFGVVKARRYNALGQPTSGEFFVSSAEYISTPAIAIDGMGNLILVWFDSVEQEIEGRRYSPTGAALGSEFVVDPYYYEYSTPAVAADSSGNFVVSWREGGIYAQRYSSTGAAVGAMFSVSGARSFNDQQFVFSEPRVAMAGDGRFVVAWKEWASSPDDYSYGSVEVFARRFGANGGPITQTFPVNSRINGESFSPGTLTPPAIAANGAGEHIIAWVSDDPRFESSDVLAQRFDAAGSRIGGEFLVNRNLRNSSTEVAVAIDAAGNFAAAWDATLDDSVNVQGTFSRMPRVSSSELRYESGVPRLDLTFNQDVGPSLSLDDFQLVRRGVGVVPASQLAMTYNPATRTGTLTFPGLLANGALPNGNYQLKVLSKDIFNSEDVQLYDDAAYPIFALGGDANRDRLVNITDFSRLAAQFNRPGMYSQGDFDFDGMVSISDFAVMAANWQQQMVPYAEIEIQSGGLEIFGSSSDRLGTVAEPTAIGRAPRSGDKQVQGGGSTSTGVVDASLSFSVDVVESGLNLSGKSWVAAPDPPDPGGGDFANIRVFTGENNVQNFEGSPIRFQVIADGPVPFSIINQSRGASASITPVSGQLAAGMISPGTYDLTFSLGASLSGTGAITETLAWQLAFPNQVDWTSVMSDPDGLSLSEVQSPGLESPGEATPVSRSIPKVMPTLRHEDWRGFQQTTCFSLNLIDGTDANALF